MRFCAVARSCLVVSPRASAAFETIIRIWEENSIVVCPELEFNVMAQIHLGELDRPSLCVTGTLPLLGRDSGPKIIFL